MPVDSEDYSKEILPSRSQAILTQAGADDKPAEPNNYCLVVGEYVLDTRSSSCSRGSAASRA
jgi:hypothetical protein